MDEQDVSKKINSLLPIATDMFNALVRILDAQSQEKTSTPSEAAIVKGFVIANLAGYTLAELETKYGIEFDTSMKAIKNAYNEFKQQFSEKKSDS